VLGTFSGLLQRLPKSGVWTVWVKNVFGVVLLGVPLFYGALAFAPALLWWTPESAEFMREYNVQGVPTIVFLDEQGRERPNTRVLGFLPPDAFLERVGL